MSTHTHTTVGQSPALLNARRDCIAAILEALHAVLPHMARGDALLYACADIPRTNRFDVTRYRRNLSPASWEALTCRARVGGKLVWPMVPEHLRARAEGAWGRLQAVKRERYREARSKRADGHALERPQDVQERLIKLCDAVEMELQPMSELRAAIVQICTRNAGGRL